MTANPTPRIKLRTSALRAYTMLLALLAIWLFFQWVTISETHPYGLFLGAINFSKLLQQTAVTGVLAVGMLMVIVSGNIDLSVGAVVGLAGGIAAMTQDWGLLPCLAAAIVVGLLIGALQGALVAMDPEDRRLIASRPAAIEQVHAVAVRQTEIEDHRIKAGASQGGICAAEVSDPIDREIRIAKGFF